MTKEQIKASVTVTEVLQRYGISVPRSKFISCPFHREKTASCYIEQRSFHCFGCGVHGDIFTLVQKMEGVSFKEAYLSLGGTYFKPKTRTQIYASKYRLAEIKRQKELAEIRTRWLREEIKIASTLIDIWRPIIKRYEPFSDEWSEAMEGYIKAFQRYDLAMEELNSF